MGLDGGGEEGSQKNVSTYPEPSPPGSFKILREGGPQDAIIQVSPSGGEGVVWADACLGINNEPKEAGSARGVVVWGVDHPHSARLHDKIPPGCSRTGSVAPVRVVGDAAVVVVGTKKLFLSLSSRLTEMRCTRP